MDEIIISEQEHLKEIINKIQDKLIKVRSMLYTGLQNILLY